jgi:23S rRNA (cytidine1920-2'-O)/16S rRNA (cytidine1409-2'-O)-methyltransferase
LPAFDRRVATPWRLDKASQVPPTPSNPYVSRGGLKLGHALDEFKVDVKGLTCADLGASTGGFTDCLLQHGATRVYAIDTAYGQLAWKLRQDPRVVVIERTNALHAVPPEGGVDVVVADLGWTKQSLLIPAALKWLKASGRIISLIKPHYEAGNASTREGILAEAEAQAVLDRVIGEMPRLGVEVLAVTRSPILGGSKGTGNIEWLAMLRRASNGPTP